MNKRLIFFSTISAIILVSTYYLIFIFVIGNDEIKFIKDKIPNYLNWKYIVKTSFYPPKEDPFIIIKTDGQEAFNLSEKNNIYIHINNKKTNTLFKNNLEITGVLSNKYLKCFEAKFKNDFILNLANFKFDCEEAIYFIGKADNFYFYFAKKQKENNKINNLLILPVTNFYDYSGNIYGKNFINTSTPFISQLNEIPTHPKKRWAYSTADSIHNIHENIKNYNIISDYNIEETLLDNYDLIILPLHQEKLSKKFMSKLESFLEKKNKIILSIGGGNFLREVTFEENFILYDKKKYLNSSKFKISRVFKDCYFIDDANFILGEVSETFSNENIENYFNKIECKDKTKISLLSVIKFNNGGKLIHLNSDQIGINYNKFKYLKLKIIEELAN